MSDEIGTDLMSRVDHPAAAKPHPDGDTLDESAVYCRYLETFAAVRSGTPVAGTGRLNRYLMAAAALAVADALDRELLKPKGLSAVVKGARELWGESTAAATPANAPPKGG